MRHCRALALALCSIVARRAQGGQGDSAGLLAIAVENNDVPAARALLMSGEASLAVDEGEVPMLHKAIASRSTDMVTALLRLGADPTTLDNQKRSALQHAIAAGDIPVLEALLDGAKDVLDLQSSQPMHLAARGGKEGVMRALHERNVGVNTQSPWDKTVPLHAASRAGQTEAVRFLIEAGAVLDAPDAWGATPLHHAAEAGDYESIRMLAAAGARISTNDLDRRTALHKAAQYGHTEAVLALVQAGALKDALDVKGRLPGEQMDPSVSPEVRAAINQALHGQYALSTSLQTTLVAIGVLLVLLGLNAAVFSSRSLSSQPSGARSGRKQKSLNGRKREAQKEEQPETKRSAQDSLRRRNRGRQQQKDL
ncbi:unnamed protein product [Chrysoparadoxa australica]